MIGRHTHTHTHTHTHRWYTFGTQVMIQALRKGFTDVHVYLHRHTGVHREAQGCAWGTRTGVHGSNGCTEVLECMCRGMRAYKRGCMYGSKGKGAMLIDW